MNIEPLEHRIAPAILFTYTELDGDLVTVSISKGSLGDATFTHPPVPGLFGDQLQTINLNGNAVFKGANITVTAKQQDLTGNGFIRGDGLANVGFIDASGIDLGTISIRGDVAKIAAGDANLTTPGLASLKAISVALFGTATGAPDIISNIAGRLGAMTITSDFAGGLNAGTIGSVKIGGNFSGGMSSSDDIGPVKIGGDYRGTLSAQDKLASLTIGGSMIAGFLLIDSDTGPIKIAGDFRTTGSSTGIVQLGGKLAGLTIGGSFLAGPGQGGGRILCAGDMGVLTIGGDLRSTGASAGTVFCGGKLAAVKIGGSIVGGGDNSAVIRGGEMGPVRIAGDLVGGLGDNSAKIVSDGNLASVTIGGSIIGGVGDFSANVVSAGALGALKIAVDLRGGTPTNGGDPSIDGSGYVEAQRIGSVFIGGSIVAGSDFTAGDAPTKNASIRARDDIGSLTVKGSLAGNSFGDDVDVIISARGKAGVGPGVTTDVAIGKISIGGGMTFARILAGFDPELGGANADAQIGAVTIGGDVLSANIIAGVKPGADGFGNFNDAKLSGMGVLKDTADGLGAISRIASIVIKGHALGTLASNDNAVFGIEAQRLGMIKVGGIALFLRPGAGNDLFNAAGSLGPTRTPSGDGFDFHAFEVPLT